MIRWTGVMPFAYLPYADAFAATTSHRFDKVMYIDNTKNNIGVAASWNKGIHKMFLDDNDWLIIISATMRFGARGGVDVLEQIEKHPDADIIHFAGLGVPEQPFIRGKSLGVADNIFGWWLTAIKREIIEDVGYFDENFYPVYFEDIDYDIRINKMYNGKANWLILPVEAASMGIGHGVKLGRVKAPVEPNMEYFIKKWGAYPKPKYDYPFNRPLSGLDYWPKPERTS